MSVTKLRTVGSWKVAFWHDGAGAELRANVRGRVITGMLTGGDLPSEGLTVAPDPREPRSR